MLKNAINETKALTPNEFFSFRSWFYDEVKRREASPAVEAAQIEIIKELRASSLVSSPKSVASPSSIDDFSVWVNPDEVVTSMYLPEDVVSHNDRVWESIYQGLNPWEPGSDPAVWVDITDKTLPSEVKEFVSPTNESQAYNVGDKVTFNGSMYESTVDGNVVSPAEDPIGWRLV